MAHEALKHDERHWRLSDQVNLVEQRSRILSLVRRGATAQQVSDTLAAGDPQAGIEPVEVKPEKVKKIVKDYLDKVHSEDELTIEHLRVLENERLDDVWLQLQRMLKNPDGSLNLKVVDRLTRLSERRAKMNGLDAAERHDVFVAGGLSVLGIEQEHLDRSQQAFMDTFERPGIPEEAVDGEATELTAEEFVEEAAAQDDRRGEAR